MKATVGKPAARRRLLVPSASHDAPPGCRAPLRVGLVAATVALAACTSAASTGEVTPPADGARSIDIRAGDLSFAPAALELVAGEDIAVTLSSTDVEHNLVIDDVDFFVEAEAGERQTSGLRIDTPGTYTAYCSIPGHRAAGMEMTVTVTE